MKEGSVRIIGWGEAQPPANQLVGNAAVLEKLYRASPTLARKTAEQTTELVGIERRWWSKLSSTELAYRATENALTKARTNSARFQSDLYNIQLIHSGGSTPDDVFPACACRLQGLLDIPPITCECRDISLACASFVDGLILADDRMRSQNYQFGLVAVGETIGSRLNHPSSLDYTLWGDGGAAIVLEHQSDGDPDYGYLAGRTVSDGQFAHWTRSIGLGTATDSRNLHMNASMEGHQRQIHAYAIRQVPAVIAALLEEHHLPARDAYLLPHNANEKMVMAIGKRIGVRPERVLTRISQRGNTSSASIGLTLAHYAEAGPFQRGDLLILAAFGAGMVVSVAAYRWG